MVALFEGKENLNYLNVVLHVGENKKLVTFEIKKNFHFHLS